MKRQTIHEPSSPNSETNNRLQSVPGEAVEQEQGQNQQIEMSSGPVDAEREFPEDQEPAPEDPFNPANLRIDQRYLDQPVGKKLLTTVPVRRPNKQDFIQVHPDPKYRLPVALIELREDREMFLVTPSYAQELEEGTCQNFQLTLAINRQGVAFLWPARLPDPSGRVSTWQMSAMSAIDNAVKNWIRVVPNMSLGAYDVIVAEKSLFEPKWPKLPMHELLRIAFKDKVISGPDHPVMQKLRGAIS
jgi:hypothetical protein